MRKRNGFSLIEVLLVLTLSSFIMLALMQAYRMLVGYIDRAKVISKTNQRIALLMHVLDRDFFCACMPFLHQEIQSDKKDGEVSTKVDQEQDEKVLSDEEKKQKEAKDREMRKKYFFTEIDDSDFRKIGKKRVELLKSCNFVTTNVLESYEESVPRFARVRYELVLEKKTGISSFSLIRKQTADIHNVKMKISEVDPAAALKAAPIEQHTLITGLKGFYIEFSKKKKIEKKDDQKKEEQLEEIRSFNWGESKKTMGEFPQRAHVYIDLWNDDKTASEVIELEIVILCEPDLKSILGVPKNKAKTIVPGGSALDKIKELMNAKVPESPSLPGDTSR